MQGLTPIQRQVFDLSLQGASPTEIGRRLQISRQRAKEILETIERKKMRDESGTWSWQYRPSKRQPTSNKSKPTRRSDLECAQSPE